MRITIVIGGLTGGGAERVTVNLANAWVERGRQVTLLTVAQNQLARGATRRGVAAPAKFQRT